ncbi:MAG: hypothetical protein D6732_13070 [Methanobacteriota archaeon]|nr:MAG: hypothetical protein D6732_13070 [Euryarchaeota archaeon]
MKKMFLPLVLVLLFLPITAAPSIQDGTPVAIINGNGGILTSEDLKPFIGVTRVRLTNAALIFLENLDLSTTAINIDDTQAVIMSNIHWINFRVNDNLEIENVGNVTLNDLTFSNGEVGGITADSLVEIKNTDQVTISNTYIDNIKPFSGKSQTNLSIFLFSSVTSITIQDNAFTDINMSYADLNTKQAILNISDANTILIKNNTFSNLSTVDPVTFDMNAIKITQSITTSIADNSFLNWNAKFANFYPIIVEAQQATISKNTIHNLNANAIDPITATISEKTTISQNSINVITFNTETTTLVQSEAISLIATKEPNSTATISDNTIQNISISKGPGGKQFTGIFILADALNATLSNNSIQATTDGSDSSFNKRLLQGISAFTDATITMINNSIQLQSDDAVTAAAITSNFAEITNSTFLANSTTKAITISINSRITNSLTKITNNIINAIAPEAEAIMIQNQGIVNIDQNIINSTKIATSILTQNNVSITLTNNKINAPQMVYHNSKQIDLNCNNNTFNGETINECLVGNYVFIGNIPLQKDTIPILLVGTILLIAIPILIRKYNNKN